MPSTSRPYIGKTALANARIAYDDFRRTFQNDKFKALAEKGAKVQRPLWASTSTKYRIETEICVSLIIRYFSSIIHVLN